MPSITQAEAKEFLNNIIGKDKVAIIHHDDGDGFASGILFYDWCKLKGAKPKQFTYTIKVTSIKHLDLKPFNKIIISDLASGFLRDELLDIPEDKEIFYTDHHPEEGPFPEHIKYLITSGKGYMPSSRTAGELTGLKPWLSLIGTISDAAQYYPENLNFIESHLKELDMNLEEFKQKASSVVTNFLIYFSKDYEKAFKILQKISSFEELKILHQYSNKVENEVQKFVEEYEEKKEKIGNVNFYYFEPSFSIKPAVCAIISDQDKTQTYIFATPKKETDKITLSARNTTQHQNMIDLLKAGRRGLEDATSGGHFGAAGGRILAKDLEKFKQNIRDYLQK